MAYNKNTNWDNEKKYLDNLSKNGNAGEKAWAENQKKVLADAQTKYGGSSNTSKNTGSNKNSQYTGSSNTVKVNNSLQQIYKDEMNANSKAWYNADDAEKQRLHARNQELAGLLGGTLEYNPVTGYWGGEAGGITADDIVNWEDNYNQENERPTTPKTDPRIEQMLNEILNRDGFSYDAMSDPLYQQYADMYRREGDRAMRETMAEAAAGAGGMNTYAMTAAMQANNYYNSQLNDKIPELYQAAYDKYLKDIDLKIRDMGLLQDMDDTQYARYRDTMSDWKDDKKFAYGAYMDAVNQNNWQTNFDNNNYWANKNFDNENFWANKEFDWKDLWKNTEWDANRGDIEYERSQAEEETAKAEIDWLIQNGVTTIDPQTIEAAGLTQETVNQMIAYFKQQQALQMAKGKSSGGGSGKGNGNDLEPLEKKEEEEDDGDDITKLSYQWGDETKTTTPVKDTSSADVLGLGIGAINLETQLQLVQAGAVIVKNDGSLKWANGYGPDNWREALNKLHTSSILPGLSILP